MKNNLKQCLICKKDFYKPSKESFKQFELRRHCSVKCQAMAKKEKPNLRMRGNKYRLGYKMTKIEKDNLSKKLTGRKQTQEHIINALRARGVSEESKMITKRKNSDSEYKEKMYEYRYFYNLKKLFNMTKEDYERLLVKQNGVCVVCEDASKNTRRLSVDHDHKTGKVRGLLCMECNMVLGLVKDEVGILQNMIKYLKNI